MESITLIDRVMSVIACPVPGRASRVRQAFVSDSFAVVA